jgi:hypothetical protein
MRRHILILSASVTVLAACAAEPKMEDAQYWQRSNATSALYLEGPKAQQTLHQDIANCTNEINELQHLGAMRRAIPADTQNGQVSDPESPQGRMAGWDTPERDGYLRAEHSDYHDFETCMDAKGWERVEYLPYTTADRARQEYLENMNRNEKRVAKKRELVTSVHENAQSPAPYKDLNN